MADPTEYDQKQDDRLDQVEEVLTVGDTEPSGDEISFPIVNSGLSAAQFKMLAVANGNGILSKRNAYFLTDFRDTDDTARLNISWDGPDDTAAIIAGFWHNLRSSRRIEFPSVENTTTYHLTLTYDPLNESSPQGPVRVQNWEGEPPKTGGKEHVILYTVTRQRSQLLTDATVQQYRQGICPVIRVSLESQMPPAEDQIYGSICEVANSNQRFRVTYGANPTASTEPWWEEIDPKPYDSGDMTFASEGHVPGNDIGRLPRYRREGDWVSLYGSFSRSGGSNFQKGGDYYFGSIRSIADRPLSSHVQITAGSKWDTVFRVEILTNGQVRAMPLFGNSSHIRLDGIRYLARQSR